MTSSLAEIYDRLHRQHLPEICKVLQHATMNGQSILMSKVLHLDHTAYAKVNTQHVAGFDAWLTAKALLKLALKLHVAGYDISLLQLTNGSADLVHVDGSSVQSPPFEENWPKMLDLELTPEKAVIPPWDDVFWSYFGNRLRIFGTVEGYLCL